MFLPQQVHTGGQRYLTELFAYLQSQGVPVEQMYLEHSTEGRTGLNLAIDARMV